MDRKPILAHRPRLVVDASLPYLRDSVEQVAEALFQPSEAITRKQILQHKAEGLLIRSVCRCNKDLLEDTPIRFIASATAGMDHIDTNYCTEHRIAVYNAAGCNAEAVAQYLFSSLARYALQQNRPLASYTLGIVGVGNVGRAVYRYASTLGMKTLLCDPPREAREKERASSFSSLREVLKEADIITLHVPLTHQGLDATYHLINDYTLSFARRKPLLVNVARGAVIDTQAVLQALDKEVLRDVVIDCWENEPVPNPDLLRRAFIATPHIAGFSSESKARGSKMIFQAMCAYFQITGDDSTIAPPANTNPRIDAKGFGDKTIEETLRLSVDIETIEVALRKAPLDFERLRTGYSFHREPSSYEVHHVASNYQPTLRALGFSLPQVADNDMEEMG